MAEETATEHPKLFTGDVVSLPEEPNVHGIIVKLGWENAEDDEGDEADDEGIDLDKESVRVGIPGKEDIDIEASKLVVVDRPYMHGDVVYSSDNPKRFGTVVGLELSVNVSVQQVGDDKPQILRNVPARELQPIHPFQRGAHVLKDGMLGVVQECKLDVTIKFADGGVCVVHEPDEEQLQSNDAGVSSLLQAQMDPTEFFPGQKVKSTPKVFKAAKWLKGKYGMKRAGTVVAVQPSTVIVRWQVAQDPEHAEIDEDAGNVTDVSTLMPLDLFAYTRWQIGDPTVLTDSLKAKYLEKGESKAEKKKPAAKKGAGAVAAEESEAGWPGMVVDSITRVDVLWQDGTVDKNVVPMKLCPVEDVTDSESDFFPGTYVVDKETKQVGYFVKRNADGSAVIKYLKEVFQGEINDEDDDEEGDEDEDDPEKLPKKKPEKPEKPEVNVDDLSEETKDNVSFETIARHPELDFHLGGVVIKIPPPQDEDESNEKPKSPAFPQGEWAGTVVGVADGKVQVVWSNGKAEQVNPETIAHMDGGFDYGGDYGDDFDFFGEGDDDEEGDDEDGGGGGGMRGEWVEDGDEEEEEEEERPKKGKAKKGAAHKEDHHSHAHSHGAAHPSSHGHSHAHGSHGHEHGGHGGHGGHDDHHGHSHAHGAHGHSHAHGDEDDDDHHHGPAAKSGKKKPAGKSGAKGKSDVEFSDEAKAALLAAAMQQMNMGGGAGGKKGKKGASAASSEPKFEWEDSDKPAQPAAKKGGKKKAAAKDEEEEDRVAEVVAALLAARQNEEAAPKAKAKKKVTKEVVEATVDPKAEQPKEEAKKKPKKKVAEVAEAAEPKVEQPKEEAKKKGKKKTSDADAVEPKKAPKAKAVVSEVAESGAAEVKKKSQAKPAAAEETPAPAATAEPKKKAAKAKTPAAEETPTESKKTSKAAPADATEAEPKKKPAKAAKPASTDEPAPAEPKKKVVKKAAEATAEAPSEEAKQKPKAKPAAKKKSQVPEA